MLDDSDQCNDHPHLNNSGQIIVDTIVNSSFPNEKVLEYVSSFSYLCSKWKALFAFCRGLSYFRSHNEIELCNNNNYASYSLHVDI